MALEAAPAEGPPRTRTGRGINRAGATPSSHICQARPSPLRRRRARSSTASATAHSSSTASGSATAAACSLSRRRPWLSGALSIPRLHQHQARQRPATVGTTLTPREDGGTLRPQARLHPGSSDPPPIDAEVDSCGMCVQQLGRRGPPKGGAPRRNRATSSRQPAGASPARGDARVPGSSTPGVGREPGVEAEEDRPVEGAGNWPVRSMKRSLQRR